MKKSFTLKAFAFGAVAALAVSATAAPVSKVERSTNRVFRLANQNKMEAPAVMRDMKVGGQLATSMSKIAAQKAEASYGEFGPLTDGTYYYVQLFGGNGTSAPYQFKRADDSANPGQFKIEISDWAAGLWSQTGTTLPITVAEKTYLTDDQGATETAVIPSIDGAIATPGTGIIEEGGTEYPVMYTTYSNWLKALHDAGETWGDGTAIEQWDWEQWNVLSSYNNLSGMLQYFPVYYLQMDGKPSWYAYSTKNTSGQYLVEGYQMTGYGYKNYDVDVDVAGGYYSHQKDANTGKYVVNYNFNDNVQIAMRIVTGSPTGTTAQKGLQALVNDLANDTKTDLFKSTESTGVAELPISNYRKGAYTIYVVYTDGIEDEEGNVTYSGYTVKPARLAADDMDYYDAGTATFTDNFMWWATQFVFGSDWSQLEFPETTTTVVPVQANSKVAGEYRLVHPYAEYYKEYLSDYLDYDSSLDYLLYNTSDPAKTYILPSSTGINYSTKAGGDVIIQIGSTNKFENGNPDADNMWGTFANEKITFPALTDEALEEFDPSTTPSALSIAFSTFSSTTSGTNIATPEAEDLYTTPYPDANVIAFGSAGIGEIATDSKLEDLNAPVEYYNLQGIRVLNPEAGQLLIKRQGSKASKIVIR